jgi:putative PIN family toxin of toxin-antitoxin system
MTHEAAHEPQTDRQAPVDAPRVVLDTNVVLDWLLFNDVSCQALAARIQTRQWLWHTSAAMRAELLSVLPRPEFSAWQPNCERILSSFDSYSIVSSAEEPMPGYAAPHCRDPDDQKFIDLAYARGARWLFSRDRALLDLARPARARGLEILTPANWLRRYPALEHQAAPPTKA